METKTELPTFAALADMRCQEASLGTKTINVKVAINTARMMVEAEDRRAKAYKYLLAAAEALIRSDDLQNAIDNARAGLAIAEGRS